MSAMPTGIDLFISCSVLAGLAELYMLSAV